MKTENLDRAVAEARRFIQIAERVKVNPRGHVIDCCKETAATKRASMDLTRALSDLRRP